jgi:hypothetical protein
MEKMDENIGLQVVDPLNVDLEMNTLGFKDDETPVLPQVTEQRQEAKPAETVKPIEVSKEETAVKAETPKPKTTSEKLMESLGKKVKVDPVEGTQVNASERIAELETKIKVNEESMALITQLNELPSDERDLIGETVQELIELGVYSAINENDPYKKAAMIIQQARGNKLEEIIALKNKQKAKEPDNLTYEQLAGGGKVRANADDPAVKIAELRKLAGQGVSWAQNALLDYEIDNGPEGNYIKKLLGT